MATYRNILREETEILYTKGRSALSDYHLIAAIGGITSEQAKAILAAENYSLASLAKYSLHDWMKVGGIGEAKATALVLAFEMGRRRIREPEQKKMKICCSSDIYQIMKTDLLDELLEHFYIILLNRNNQVIRKLRISTGGTCGTIADPKVIFKHALENQSCSMILVHNHPSGNLKPSEQDRRLTQKLSEAGKCLDIIVLDHIIFTDCAYFSFADEGMM